MDAIEAIAAEIIDGRLAYRPARVLLALARAGGTMGARQLAEQTGIDRAHVLRALAALEDMGWIVRDKTGARMAPEAVDKRAPKEHTCAEKAHGGSVPKEHTGSVPKKHTCAEKAHGDGEATPAPLLGKPDLSTGEKWHDSCRSCSSSSYLRTTTTTTTTPQRVPKERTPTPTPTPDALPDLVWPQCLHEALRAQARKLLARLDAETAQACLDELAGRSSLQTIANPLAYLQGLVAKASAGEFVAAAGVPIAEGRRRYAEMRARMEEQRAALTREAAAGGVRYATR